MSISRLFLWFYRFSPFTIILFFLVGTAVFLLVDRRLDEKLLWRLFLMALLMLWACAVIWVTILSRSGETAGAFQTAPFHSYREVLSGGNIEILRSNFMNTALFFPAGLLLGRLLPRRWSALCRLLTVLLLFAGFSFAVEIVQYSRLLGHGEIDDVIHNTLGAMLGCLAVSFGTQKLFTPKRRDLP